MKNKDKQSRVLFFLFILALEIATFFSYTRHMVYYNYPLIEDDMETSEEESTK